MDPVTLILATTNEISLKGGNRGWFEKTLTANLRRALAGLPLAAIRRPSWRVLISFREAVDFNEVSRRLSTVFGLNSFMPVRLAGQTLPALREALAAGLTGVTADSFAVRCTRSDKSFPRTSPEVEREIGTLVQERTGWPVDLRHPDLTVGILIDDGGIYFWTRKVPGAGGLPVGVGGRALCLLSGGIDSPVAGWHVLKRGVRLDFIHFHSMPRTNPASIEKVERMVSILNRSQGSARLALVPLLAVQEAVIAGCPAELRVPLYRRFMLRIADVLASRFRSRGLVTGEALGQVASQTIENLAAVEAIARRPVLRPLIGFDKQEIIARARAIGTYEISIEPHQDCCSYLLPANPATRSTPSQLASAEAALDVGQLVADAVRQTEVRRLSAADQIHGSGQPVRAGA
jgi:thiamine biosynthesis protein ThiI